MLEKCPEFGHHTSMQTGTRLEHFCTLKNGLGLFLSVLNFLCISDNMDLECPVFRQLLYNQIQIIKKLKLIEKKGNC